MAHPGQAGTPSGCQLWAKEVPGAQGSRDLPLDCFEIQEFVIDRDMVCTEGFSFPPHHVNAMSEDEAWPD